MHLFVWKAHQHGACGFGLTIGPLLWAGTHDCVVVCCITSRTARFLFPELVGMLFSFWCLSLRVGLSRPSHSYHQFALRALQFLHWTILPSVCPQLVTCLRPHGLFPAPVSAPNPEVAALRGLVHRLVDLCESNQRKIRSLREEFSQLRSLMISRFPAPLPSPAALSGAPHMVPPPLLPGASPPVPPPVPHIAHEVPRPDRPSVNHCRRSGCSSPSASFVPCGFLPNPLHQLSVFPSLHSHSTLSCQGVLFFGSTFLCRWVLRVSLHQRSMHITSEACP